MDTALDTVPTVGVARKTVGSHRLKNQDFGAHSFCVPGKPLWIERHQFVSACGQPSLHIVPSARSENYPIRLVAELVIRSECKH